MSSIQNAYNWAVETCAADNVGYSQQYRNQQTVNGITYYDCSSFIWYALVAGGFDVKAANGGSSWPFTTSTEAACLRVLGFVKHSPDEQWKPGDILIRTAHTEMAFDETRTMGAHTSKAPLAEQVSINANDSRGNWLELWRWENGAVNEWIKGNMWLTIGEMQNNATIVFNNLLSNGFTVESICGILGNAGGPYTLGESSINPGIWQNLTPNPQLGFGLFQWTPSTNYTDWADANGYEHDDGYGQLDWLVNQTVPTGQWIPTTDYPETFDKFKISTKDPEYLAYAFLNNFERAADRNQPARQSNARYWYDWYTNSYVPPDNPPQNGGEWSSKMPIWFYLKRRL